MKNKAVLYIAAAGLSAALLMGCGEKPTTTDGPSNITLGGQPTSGTEFQETTPTSAPNNDSKFSADDCKLVINGVTIKLGDDFVANVDKVGKLVEKVEGQACLDAGNDTNYYYDGFTVFTLAKDGKQVIYSVEVTLEGFKDLKGVEIGKTTEEELVNLYGAPTVNEKLRRSYDAGNYSLVFFVENGVVTEVDIVDKSVA